MTNKDKAAEIYAKHIELASTDGRLFRKTVMDEIMSTCNCTLAASATFYNNAKKNAAPVEGLGRAPVSKSVRKPGSGKAKPDAVQDDNECFTVIELLKHEDSITVGRCRSHLMQGDASEEFDDRIKYQPSNTWVMIQGLGPLHGETFKLGSGEVELKRYTPAKEAVVAKEEPLLVD
jgi:hypothetical protein